MRENRARVEGEWKIGQRAGVRCQIVDSLVYRTVAFGIYSIDIGAKEGFEFRSDCDLICAFYNITLVIILI